MIVGNKDEFAVEFEVLIPVDQRWIYGKFCFWANGLMVGDNVDTSVDLKGCLNWLKDFVSVKRNRFEPGLFDMPTKHTFRLLTEGVLVHFSPNEDAGEVYHNSLPRFHLSHLGMSAFDRTTIVLVENESGDHKLIWTSPNEDILEAMIPSGVIERVFCQTIERMEEALIPPISN